MCDSIFQKHRNLFFSVSILLFLLLFSRSTSPLYYVMGEDSCIFMIIGRELLHGKIPYVDLYENKGPFLYFIQAFPQIFWSSRYSIFILQFILWFIQFKIIDKVSLFLFHEKSHITTFIVFFLFALFNYEEGNLAEEYNLFFSFVALYFFIQIIETSRTIIPGIFMGIALSAVALIRINDVVLICIYILCAFIFILSNPTPIRKCIRYLLSCMIGAGIIVVPTFFYYYRHNAFSDMLQGYLFVNTQYVEGQSHSFLLDRFSLLGSTFGIICLFIFIISLFAAYIFSKHRDISFTFRVSLWLLPMMAVPALFVSKSGFLHYTFILELPLALDILIIQHDMIPTVDKHLYGGRKSIPPIIVKLAAIIIVCLLNLAVHGIITYPITANNHLIPIQSDYITAVDEMMSHIPEKDYDSIYVINGFSANFYMETDTLPSYRYFLPLTYAEISPAIEAELIQYFQSTPPKWIILADWSEVQSVSDEIYQLLIQQYEQVDILTDRIMLYSLK